MEYHLNTPLTKDITKKLRAGDYVYLTGTIFSARDAAHIRLHETLVKGDELPIDMKDTIIYYMGPTPAREGRPVGSAGPTTSSRMDKYTPELLDLGVSAVIGKGRRSEEVTKALVRNGAVYFAAVGGAGALLSQCIHSAEVIAYEDLDTEAIRSLEIRDFPIIVVIDSEGNNLYNEVYEKINPLGR